jgi:hypothetical protein
MLAHRARHSESAVRSLQVPFGLAFSGSMVYHGNAYEKAVLF